MYDHLKSSKAKLCHLRDSVSHEFKWNVGEKSEKDSYSLWSYNADQKMTSCIWKLDLESRTLHVYKRYVSPMRNPTWLPCSNEQYPVVFPPFQFTGQNPTWQSLRTASCWPSTRRPTPHLPCTQTSLAEDGLCFSGAPLRAFSEALEK